VRGKTSGEEKPVYQYHVRLKVRAVLRHEFVEFAKELALPFIPYPGLIVCEGAGSEYVLGEVAWHHGCGLFICRVSDTEAAERFGEDERP
jgi:hypothetical protein